MGQNPAWRVGEELMSPPENPEDNKIGKRIALSLIFGAIIVASALRWQDSHQKKDQSANSVPQNIESSETPVVANR